MNKRKYSVGTCESGGEDSDEGSSITIHSEEDGPGKKMSKQNHSAIEKKRREKMNTYIQELSSMIPTCNAMKSKLDKLTILRMAVQHMKTIRGCPSSYREANYKPSFLSADELKSLILESAEGFLIVVSCDRGRMLYVSESVINTLCVSREHLIGQSLFDILHPKDMAKVKEQLSSSDLTPRERFIDTKTGLPVKSEVVPVMPQLSSGSRRSFFCRMRQYSKENVIKTEEQPTFKKKPKIIPDRKKYATIQCTGYLKSWPLSQIGVEYDNERDGDTEGCTLSCLIAIAKATQDMQQIQGQPGNGDPSLYQFVSRQAMDGKFTYIDQRATAILGYLPQELLGTSCYEYIHVADIKQMAENHYEVLLKKEKIETNIYRFRAKNGLFLKLKSKLFCFRNPWTKEVEYIVSTNTVVAEPEKTETAKEVRRSNDGNAVVENILGDIATDSAMMAKTYVSEIGPRNVVYKDLKKSCMYGKGEVVLQMNTIGTGSNGPSYSLGIPPVLQDVPGMPCNLHPAAAQIGWKIAEEVFEKQWNMSASSSPGGLLEEDQPGSSDVSTMPNSSKATSSDLGKMLTSSQATSAGNSRAPIELVGGNQAKGPFPTSADKEGSEGWEDESAMAFIMNLLEADAGLGGAVDFTRLPWPLLNG